MGRIKRILAPATVVASFGLLLATRAFGEGSPVPPTLQATLTAKVAAFDHALPARAGGKLKVIIVKRAGNPASAHVAAEFRETLSRLTTVATLPHEDLIVTYEGPRALADLIAREHAALVYLSTGFEQEAATLGAALGGVDVLTVASEPDAVSRGVVVGFDLISGQPKLLVNLAQAHKQGVRFDAALLRIALITGT